MCVEHRMKNRSRVGIYSGGLGLLVNGRVGVV